MPSNVEGKVIIVTGGSQGIGGATVSLFLHKRAKVASLDIVESGHAVNPDLLAITCNMAKEEDITKAVELVVAKWGRIDIVVNNAGITDNASKCPFHKVDIYALADSKAGGLVESDTALWRRVMSVNLDGPMFLMKLAIPYMLKNDSNTKGNIVNVCSIAAIRGAVAGAAYTASKHGLLGLSRNTAWMYRHRGIRVNAVLPGGVATNISQNSGQDFEATAQGQELAPYLACVPGLSQPEHLAETIFHAAVAPGLNSAEILVDLGWNAA